MGSPPLPPPGGGGGFQVACQPSWSNLRANLQAAAQKYFKRKIDIECSMWNNLNDDK
jgi:hypothetical protein